MDVFPLTEPTHEHNFTLKCVANTSPRLRQILPYLVLEWIKPTADIVMEQQENSTDNVTRTLQFSPLTMSHGGVYMCRIRLNIPNSVGNYVKRRNFDLIVFGKLGNLF